MNYSELFLTTRLIKISQESQRAYGIVISIVVINCGRCRYITHWGNYTPNSTPRESTLIYLHLPLRNLELIACFTEIGDWIHCSMNILGYSLPFVTVVFGQSPYISYLVIQSSLLASLQGGMGALSSVRYQ